MQKRKTKCPICRKKHIALEWIARKGTFKGETIINSSFCSKKCHKRFELLIVLNGVLEEIDKLK